MDEDSSEELVVVSESSKKRKSGRPKNEIWQCFNILPVDSSTGKKDLHPGAQCKFCNQIWNRGRTSEMIAHIALSCPNPSVEMRTIYLEMLNNESFYNDNNNNNNSNKKLKQSKITDHIEKLAITDDKQRRISRALTKFFVCCGIPFWIVENPFFIDFIKTLCPGYQIPKRTTLSTSMVNSEAATVIVDMRNKLANETNLTLSMFYLILLINLIINNN